MKKAFTLAEMMIVLVVIAVITAILLPAARHATPDENILKFKKAHNTLYTAIRELVNSDKYYLDGDLGVRPNGDLIDGTHDGDYTYFCNTITDILNTKNNNCSKISAVTGHAAVFTKTAPSVMEEENNLIVTKDMIESAKNWLDTDCNSDLGQQLGEQIVLNDKTVIYEALNTKSFGFKFSDKRGYAANSEAYVHDINGFGVGYKIICIDIDGAKGYNDINADDLIAGGKWTDSSSGCDDIKDICPFGYGIRADGKILNGKRADEWLEKSINKKD